MQDKALQRSPILHITLIDLVLRFDLYYLVRRMRPSLLLVSYNTTWFHSEFNQVLSPNLLLIEQVTPANLLEDIS